MTPRLKAMYKTYSEIYNTEEFVVEEFGSWREEDSYTMFFKGYSEDSIALIVPTKNVYWIRFN